MTPSQIALILIDIQRDFWGPIAESHGFKGFPGNVGTLLAAARERGLTVVHVRSVFSPDRSDWMLFYRPEGRGEIPCLSGSPGVAFEVFASPEGDERVIEKQTFDAFVGTDLEGYLDGRGVKALLIAGLETSVCVLFTANSAYLRRILPLVVSDACADEPSRHEDALRMYADLSFKTVTTAQVRDDWESILDLIGRFADC